MDKMKKVIKYFIYYVCILIIVCGVMHTMCYKTTFGNAFHCFWTFSEKKHHPFRPCFRWFDPVPRWSVYMEDSEAPPPFARLCINISERVVFVRQHCGRYFRTWKVLSIQTFSNGPRRLAFSPQSLRLNRAGCFNNISTSGKRRWGCGLTTNF